MTRALSTILFLLASACADAPSTLPPSLDGPPAIPLSTDARMVELSIAPHSRPHGLEPANELPLVGWVPADSSEGANTYEVTLPVRLRTLFFIREPSGMVLHGPNGVIPHAKRHQDSGEFWKHEAESLTLHLLEGTEPPNDSSHHIRFPGAQRRERRLNLSLAGLGDPEEFVRAQVYEGPVARRGLLLPAPSAVAFDLIVPPAAELRMTPGLVRPETVDGPPSDGAGLRVEVDLAGSTEVIYQSELSPGVFHAERVDLSAYANQAVRLRFVTTPGDSAAFDYAFVGNPVVSPTREQARRVVVVFVDTLRADHLSLYGYKKPTTPKLDHTAKTAAVFEQARSVAPWTLPSYRSMTTGNLPTAWDTSTTLQERLRDQGWATAMFAGNTYLSANFGSTRGWGHHRAHNWLPATEQVDHALEWLALQEGTDALLLLHLMDPHLPYEEPVAYRRRFAGDLPDGLDEGFLRGHLLRAAKRDPTIREHVKGRYDNNVAYVDAEVDRVVRALGPNDLLVLVSDHGEELWDHGGFEHGHTLYDELLHIPLVIRGPGVGAGRFDTPVSLLDLTPTVLDWAGLDATGMDGTSLLALTRGDEGEAERLRARPQAFGHPLYGRERWGVFIDGHKFVTHAARSWLWDIEADPSERHNLLGKADADTVPWRESIAQALGREVPQLLRLRLHPGDRRLARDCTIELSVDGGIRTAWAGADSLGNAALHVAFTDDAVVARWPKDTGRLREVFVHTQLPAQQVLRSARGTLSCDDETAPLELMPNTPLNVGPNPKPLAVARTEMGERVELTWGVSPLPSGVGDGPSGFDPELVQLLKAMGYAVGDDDDEP